MDYFLKVNNKEYGPVSEETVIKWVKDGRILPDSPLRTMKVKKWKTAVEYKFLRTAFEYQNKKYKKGSDTSKIPLPLSAIKKRNDQLLIDGYKLAPATAFKNEYLPDRSSILLRLQAGIIDILFLLIVFCAMFCAGMYFINIFQIPHNYVLIFIYSLFFAFALVYFGGSIGVFAQTFGMWYFGILLVRDGDHAGEVCLCRAYVYAILLIIFGIISPLSNFILCRRRALHDIITNTQVVRISSKSK